MGQNRIAVRDMSGDPAHTLKTAMADAFQKTFHRPYNGLADIGILMGGFARDTRDNARYFRERKGRTGIVQGQGNSFYAFELRASTPACRQAGLAFGLQQKSIQNNQKL